jgi:hypothetical protein
VRSRASFKLKPKLTLEVVVTGGSAHAVLLEKCSGLPRPVAMKVKAARDLSTGTIVADARGI